MKPQIIAVLTICIFSACSTLHHKPESAPSFPSFSYEGHRGARGLYPENSIIAMKAAIDLAKVTTLEMDCHITKDQKVVLFHDDVINPKFIQYTNGKALSGSDKNGILYNYTFDELSKFDIGSKFYADFPEQKKIPTAICLLSDLIDSVEAYTQLKRKTPLFYNIETKSTPGKDQTFHPDPATFSELLIQVLKEKNILNRTVIQSFDKRTLQYIHQKYPQIKTSYLIGQMSVNRVEDLVKDLGFKPFIISPNHKLANSEFIQEAQKLNIKVIPWTVNDKTTISKLKDLKVDGIISDYPNLY